MTAESGFVPDADPEPVAAVPGDPIAPPADAGADGAAVELEQLRGVVDNLRRGEVERLAAAELRDARDLLDRHQVGDFLDEDGYVDPARVSKAAHALISERPHMAAEPVITRPPTDRPLEGLRPGASPAPQSAGVTWKGAIGLGL